jgi:hypothetical protein
LGFSWEVGWVKNRERRSRAAGSVAGRPFVEGRDMTAETIPVTVAEDAAARAAELGIKEAFEQMLEHARQTVPQLKYLRVTLEYDPGCPMRDPQIVIWAKRDYIPPEDSLDPTGFDFRAWQAEHFPPQVFVHVLLMSVYGDVDEW